MVTSLLKANLEERLTTLLIFQKNSLYLDMLFVQGVRGIPTTVGDSHKS